MLGYSAHELEPISIETWTRLCDTDDLKASNAILDEVFAKKLEYYELEFRMKHKNGSWIWISSKGRVTSWTPDNKPIIISGTHADITERKTKADEILYLSYHDQLTGLYNRRFYEQELKRIDTERNLPLTLVMGDVNGLKLINDSFGHAKGDELLKKAANVMKAGCRADDIIARWGGDEFVLILPKTDALEAEKVINRIKYLLSKQKVESIELSVSFGSETKTSKNEKIVEIIKNTEDHLYRHKLYEGSSMKSATVDLIMNTLYEKNKREMIHSKRVSELCEATASALKFDKNAVSQIRIAGLMHDIGKIGIDEKILNSPSWLTNEEWKEIKRHSEIGYRILSSVNEFSEIADHILQHHERWDGNGYPNGISGEAISIEARIIAIADAYDAMTTDRTYGNTLSKAEAVSEIQICSGTQFDPDIAKIFIEHVLK
jgi:diguanylate cyclase (GGDEF)-like protein/putative nucleotidyltransferase with HDIG domain/PAS domain S-box-containing protein